MLKKSYSKTASPSTPNHNQSVAKEIRAEKFVLVDSDGNDRARLHVVPSGDTVFSLLDQDRNLRLTLRVGDDESAVTIFQPADYLGKGQMLDSVMLGYSHDYEPGLKIFEYAHNAHNERSDTAQEPVEMASDEMGLVDKVLAYDDDDAAHAFAKLIWLLASEPDTRKRENLAEKIVNHAFTKTIAFSEAAAAFSR